MNRWFCVDEGLEDVLHIVDMWQHQCHSHQLPLFPLYLWNLIRHRLWWNIISRCGLDGMNQPSVSNGLNCGNVMLWQSKDFQWGSVPETCLMLLKRVRGMDLDYFICNDIQCYRCAIHWLCEAYCCWNIYTAITRRRWWRRECRSHACMASLGSSNIWTITTIELCNCL